MPAEKVECESERERGGLVARNEQRDCLVAELRVRHATLLTRRGDQHRDEVAPVAALPPLADDLVDDRVERLERLFDPKILGQRETDGEDHAQASETIHQRLDRPLDLACDFLGKIYAKEGLRDNVKREVQHVFVDIALLAVLSRRDGVCGVRDHHIAVGRDPFKMETGLDELALLPPERACAHDEALAEYEGQLAGVLVLDQLFALGGENLLNRVGVVKKVDALPGENVKFDDVTVFLRDAFEESERITEDVHRAADERNLAWPGGGGAFSWYGLERYHGQLLAL
ncbi:hypothetical protein CCP3SC5AM1_3030001 [Gammaproteobacteria bacterium]